MAGAAEDFVAERDALRRDLERAGPDAPTAVEGWTAEDLAVHLALGEVAAAVPNTPFRWLVGRGVRLGGMAPVNAWALAAQRRRHGMAWALDRLERPPPRLHRLAGVAPVCLMEMWAHHEDLLAANPGLAPCDTGVDLAPVLDVLRRYHRKALARHAEVTVDGEPADLARWLSGRAGLEPLTVTGDAEAVRSLAAEPFAI